MGNSNTKSDINEVIDRIYKSEKFANYQRKFQSLNPAKILYLDDEDLIVESVDNGPYTIAIYEFDWLDTNVENEIYKDLDELYESYLPVGIVDRSNETKDNIELIEENTDKIHDFIFDSISDELNLDEWLNKYFHPESSGYKQFKSMKNTQCGCSLLMIWYLMFQQAAKQYYTLILTSIVDIELKTTKVYEVKFGGKSIVLISEIDGKFWYVGITPECFDHIQKIYNKQ